MGRKALVLTSRTDWACRVARFDRSKLTTDASDADVWTDGVTFQHQQQQQHQQPHQSVV